MALDLSSREAINKITLDNLIEDAVERGDEDALKWLLNEAKKTKERTKADGTKFEVRKSINEIRPLYLAKFLKYKSKNKMSAELAKARKRERMERELDNKFADALQRLQANKKK